MELEDVTLPGGEYNNSHLNTQEETATEEQRENAIAQLRAAVQRENASDAAIYGTWITNQAILRDYPLTSEFKERVELAGQRMEALGSLRSALSNEDYTLVFYVYIDRRNLLEPCVDFKPEERRQVRLATRRLASKTHAAIKRALCYDEDRMIV